LDILEIVTVRDATKPLLMQGLTSARDYTLRLVDSLGPEQWQVPQRPTLNLPLWELGHIGWFQEHWCLRQRHGKLPRASILPGADALYNSSTVPHQARWALPLPSVPETRDYLADVLDQALDTLERLPQTDEALYNHRLSLFHELMHIEAFAYTWQALGYAEVPAIAGELRESRADTDTAQESGPLHLPPFKRLLADVTMPANAIALGSEPGSGFVFDNEKWAHVVDLPSFEIELQPVTNAEYLQFVNDGGYRQAQFWDPDYFHAMQREGRKLPSYWKETAGRLLVRWFDQWRPVEVFQPVIHVSAFEAEAFCRWAGKRLPSEAEWVYAATHKKQFDWGDRVWEWTSSWFMPFKGFEADPYKDYSEPWFGTHRVVKGGSFMTPRSLVHPQFRNFYTPERHDFFVGFRVCSL
jgi:gamma-glutamyl hercynylcysteine S-oxide synthase